MCGGEEDYTTLVACKPDCYPTSHILKLLLVLNNFSSTGDSRVTSGVFISRVKEALNLEVDNCKSNYRKC